MTVATFVYLLCFAAALTCGALLLRGYLHSRSPLLLWSGLGFSLLTLNNLFLVADKVIWQDVDFWAVRQGSAAAAIAVFLYGFLWKADR